MATIAPIVRHLTGNLVLRRSTPADADRLAEFNSTIHRIPDTDGNPYVAAWTRDLAARPHPTFGPEDFTFVEDTETGEIVSSLNLINQTWSYDGIELGFGRPEIVGTKPEYRRKGLVRAQFDEVHRWSGERGHLVLGITGIPWYYRLFGYEMALDLGGGRHCPVHNVPELKSGETEKFTMRPATEADIPFLDALYRRGCERYPLACVRDDAIWRYELSGRSELSAVRSHTAVIEDAGGRPAGFIVHSVTTWEGSIYLFWYEVADGYSWLEVTPPVLRYMKQFGIEHPIKPETPTLKGIMLQFGEAHPVYEAADDALTRTESPYAWYMRVPDLPGFIRHIAPALERRLAGSVAAYHTGELTLNFYRNGLKLVFERGAIRAVEPWHPEPEGGGNARFPELTFLHLLFQHRSLDELRHAYPDCSADQTARAILNALFPKRPCTVWPVS